MNHVTQADFQQQVIEASRSKLVLVDFWATWCQPCRMLAPALEQIAAEFADHLSVVKVDIDREPQLADTFGIRSVPSVKFFSKGALVGEFTGVQPVSRIKTLIEPFLPRASDALIAAAHAAAEAGDRQSALARLGEALAQDPGNYRIHERLGALFLELGRLDETDALLRQLPANIAQEPPFVQLGSRLSLSRAAAQAPGLPELREAVAANPADLEARFQLASRQAADGDYDEAMAEFLDIIRTDRKFRDDGARRALLHIFELLNHDGPLVRKYRSQLAGVLN